MINICVIGLGQVGGILSLALAEKGFNVYGIDKDKDKLYSYTVKEEMPFYEKGANELLKKHLDKRLFFSDTLTEFYIYKIIELEFGEYRILY